MIRAGDEFLFYWNGEALPAQANGDFTHEVANRITSNKQSGKFEQSVPTRSSGSLSITLLSDSSASLTLKDLDDAATSGDIEDIKMSTEEIGDDELIGTGYLSNISPSFPDQENVEISLDVTLTGEFSWEEITA